jgi:hypothetical protein
VLLPPGEQAWKRIVIKRNDNKQARGACRFAPWKQPLHLEAFPQFNPRLDCSVDEDVVKQDAPGSIQSSDTI